MSVFDRQCKFCQSLGAEINDHDFVKYAFKNNIQLGRILDPKPNWSDIHFGDARQSQKPGAKK
jgi:hypothetical protein